MNNPFCLSVGLSQKDRIKRCQIRQSLQHSLSGKGTKPKLNQRLGASFNPSFFVHPLKCNNFRRVSAARSAMRRTGSSTRTSAGGGERRGNRGERKSLRKKSQRRRKMVKRKNLLKERESPRRRRMGTGTNPMKMDWRKKTRGRRRRNKIKFFSQQCIGSTAPRIGEGPGLETQAGKAYFNKYCFPNLH